MSNIVYKLINTINGKWLVGSTGNSIYKRFRQHMSLLRCNRHSNAHLQNAYNKYGESAFICIEVSIFTTRTQAYESEQLWLDNHFGKKYCYNENPRANAPPVLKGDKHPRYWLNKKFSLQCIKKMSESRKGSKHYLYGKHRTEDTKLKISKKITEIIQGEQNPNYKGTDISLKHDDGRIYKGKGLVKVSKELNLRPSSLCSLLKGKYKSTQGWRIL